MMCCRKGRAPWGMMMLCCLLMMAAIAATEEAGYSSAASWMMIAFCPIMHGALFWSLRKRWQKKPEPSAKCKDSSLQKGMIHDEV